MKVKVKIIENLLDLVVIKGEVLPDHGGLGILCDRINKELDESLFNQKYLYYNIFKKVEKLKNNPESQIGLNLTYLNKLSSYIGYQDFFQFKSHFEKEALGEVSRVNQGTNPTSDQLEKIWYTHKPFRIFDIWRNPDLGQLILDEPLVRYYGTNKQLVISELLNVEPFTMPGDGRAYWVRIDFKENGKDMSAYFANASGRKRNLNVGEVKPLINFFKNITSKPSFG